MDKMLKTEEEARKAIEALKSSVNEILESESKDYYGTKFTEMTKNFFYLQQLHKHYKPIPEYEEAKKLIESIGTKDQQFVEYFKQFVNED